MQPTKIIIPVQIEKKSIEDMDKVKDLKWWIETHYTSMCSIGIMLSLLMIFNAVMMINLELNELPMPYLWKLIGAGIIICITLQWRVNRCNEKIENLGWPKYGPEDIFTEIFPPTPPEEKEE